MSKDMSDENMLAYMIVVIEDMKKDRFPWLVKRLVRYKLSRVVKQFIGQGRNKAFTGMMMNQFIIFMDTLKKHIGRTNPSIHEKLYKDITKCEAVYTDLGDNTKNYLTINLNNDTIEIVSNARTGYVEILSRQFTLNFNEKYVLYDQSDSNPKNKLCKIVIDFMEERLNTYIEEEYKSWPKGTERNI